MPPCPHTTRQPLGSLAKHMFFKTTPNRRLVQKQRICTICSTFFCRTRRTAKRLTVWRLFKFRPIGRTTEGGRHTTGKPRRNSKEPPARAGQPPNPPTPARGDQPPERADPPQPRRTTERICAVKAVRIALYTLSGSQRSDPLPPRVNRLYRRIRPLLRLL